MVGAGRCNGGHPGSARDHWGDAPGGGHIHGGRAMRTRLVLVVVALLLALGGASAAATTASQSSQKPGDHGGPKSGECEDGVDNDHDGLTDADDPACQQPGCMPSSQTPQKCDEADLSPENPEAGNCSDGIDNDGDGLTDGDDPDCGQAPEPGTCANG